MPNVQPAGTKGSFCWGGLSDTELAVDHVANKHPGMDICGVGLSLGGGQLRNYVNTTGSACKLSACVVVDAADCFAQSSQSLDHRRPFGDSPSSGACPQCWRAASAVLNK